MGEEVAALDEVLEAIRGTGVGPPSRFVWPMCPKYGPMERMIGTFCPAGTPSGVSRSPCSSVPEPSEDGK